MNASGQRVQEKDIFERCDTLFDPHRPWQHKILTTIFLMEQNTRAAHVGWHNNFSF